MPVGHVEVVSTTPESNREGFVVRQVGEVSPVAATDSLANPTAFQRLAHGMQWNNAAWEREYANFRATVISNANRTVDSADSGQISNFNHRGLHAVLHYSSGEAAINLRVEGHDLNSGSYYAIASTATVSASGTTAYVLYPGISAGPASFNTVLPRVFRLRVVATGSLTANYGVSYSLIV